MLKKFTLGLGLGLCISAAVAMAQPTSDIKAASPHSAYLQDSNGNIVRTDNGMCWRTGFWTPADAVPGCDGPLIPPISEPTAPAIVPPPPVAQQSAPPVAPKRCDFAITMGNDQAFGFNKTTLNPAAQNFIDAVLLPQISYCGTIETVLVTGHTDRIGSTSYNQKLSEQRAKAVAEQLKNKGVSADINIVGAGETQAISACDDKLSRATLIKCLAPDRRVVIEVRGVAQ